MLNKPIVRLLLVGLIAGSLSTEAFAYIDPGTGMSFVSGIGAFIAGFFALAFGAIAVTFKRWTGAIKSMFEKSKEGGNRPG